MINPLLFIPSPRNIPDVMKWWDKIPYDKMIEKYRNPLTAYTNAKHYFLRNKQYTHFTVCPDDLEVTPDAITQLVSDIETYGYEIIAGMCNIDESKPDIYAIQPVNSQNFDNDHPDCTYGAWYKKDDKPIIPKEDIIQVGFAGFPCEMISRKVIERVTLQGATHDKQGNFDWNFTRECHSWGIPIMVDTRVLLYHRRFEQAQQAKDFLAGKVHAYEGHTIYLKAGEKMIHN